MNYFIPGASGFIGSELIRALLENGHHVTALEHKSPVNLRHPNLTIIRGDLKRIIPLLDEKKPDIIIHLARISGGRYAAGRFIRSLRARRYNEQIKNWLRKNEQVKLYYLSGSLMYGNNSEPITEAHGLNPISFAKQYHIAEKPFVDDPLKNSVVLRPGWVFGNGSWFKQFFLNVLKNTKKVPLYGDGENTMSIIHVSDLAKLIVAYTEKAPAGSVFNLYSPVCVTLRQFTEAFGKLTGEEIQTFQNEEVRRLYNTTIVEAFTSNIILDTTYKEIIHEFRFEYPDLDKLLLSEIK